MTKRNRWLASILAGTLLATVCNGSLRADEANAADWQISVKPYMWALQTEGNIGLGQHPDVEADLSFSDILDNLDFYLAGRIEARKGKWLLYGDGMASTLGAKGGATATFGPYTRGPVTVGPFPVGPPALGQTIGPWTFTRVRGPFTETLSYDLKLKVNTAELGVAYRLGEWPIDSAGRNWSLDALAGGRYTNVEVTLSLSEESSRALGLTGSNTVTDEESWIDPFVGLRLGVDLSSKWDLVASADVGGFGVGSDSTWNAWAMINYHWSESTHLSVGYRGLHQDYESGSGSSRFKWDETLHGPVVGLEFRF